MTTKPLLGPCDSYQLEPFAYPWAWDMAKNQEKNTWQPEEIAVGGDVADFKDPDLDPKYRHLFESVMAQLTTFDIERGDDAAETFLSILQPAEIRHYLKRLVWDEALHCYEEGTEVLTSEGWVDFRDLSDSAVVAQVSMDGQLSFARHCGITRDYHDGVLYEWSNKAIHTSVTPNHRCVEILDHPQFGDENRSWNIVRAKDLTQSNRRWPVAASSVHGEETELSPMDRLRIAFQADGHMRSANRVSFHFSKERKISRIKNILDACGLEYECAVYPSAPNKTQVLIRTPLRLSKRLADWVHLANVSDTWARQFIDELVQWDGSITPTGRYRWSCHDTDGENMGLVQAIAVLAGRHGRISGHEMSLVDRAYVDPETARKHVKPYRGYVYSVGVPTGIIVTRFHGKVLISGNTRSYRYVIENLGIPLTIYDRWKEVPAMKARVEMAQEISAPLLKVMGWMYLNDEPMPQGTWIKSKQEILRSMIFWFLIFEGVWFWVNLLGPIQQLSRLGRFKGAAEQFQYIARDEQSHIGFGHRLISEFMVQYPECLTEQFLTTVVNDTERAIQLEADFAAYCLKDGPILGYSVPEHVATAKLFANMRLGSVGLPQPFTDAYHAFPWMSEQMELKKEKNFFETRVTDYQAGGALSFDETSHYEGWDDPLDLYIIDAGTRGMKS